MRRSCQAFVRKSSFECFTGIVSRGQSGASALVPSHEKCALLLTRCCVSVGGLLTMCKAFLDSVETLLTEGKIIRADADAGTLRIAGGNAAAGGAAAGGT